MADRVELRKTLADIETERVVKVLSRLNTAAEVDSLRAYITRLTYRA